MRALALGLPAPGDLAMALGPPMNGRAIIRSVTETAAASLPDETADEIVHPLTKRARQTARDQLSGVSRDARSTICNALDRCE
jgi:hypothetical protein